MVKAVFLNVPDHVLEDRKRTGADQWDEMWEGVLHVVPSPTNPHQDLAGDLHTYLAVHWARPRKAKAYYEVNLASVGGWDHDYRIPDLLLLTRDRFSIDKGAYFEGAPNVVVEIHSAGDEAYEKLDFYARLGVPEVWIINRDTKEPEIHVLKRGRYRVQSPGTGGWLGGPGTGVEMKAGRRGKLSLRMGKDEKTREDIPTD